MLACNCYIGMKYSQQTACKHAHFVYSKIVRANCDERHGEQQTSPIIHGPELPKRQLQPKTANTLIEEAKMDQELARMASRASELIKLVNVNRSKYTPSDIIGFTRSLNQCKRVASGKITADYSKYKHQKKTTYGNLKKKFTKQLRNKIK